MQPIVVKDAANPFIEPSTVSSFPDVRAPSESLIKAAPIEIARNEEEPHPEVEPSSEGQAQQDTDVRLAEPVAPVRVPPAPLQSPGGSTRNRKRSNEDTQLNSTPHVDDTTTKTTAFGKSPAEVLVSAGLEAQPPACSILPASTEVEVEVQVQQHGETIIIRNNESSATLSLTDKEATLQASNGLDQKHVTNDDYSVPVKDDDIARAAPTSPKTAMGTSTKSSFSPSAVTFAALPTRDLPRGRSIGTSKHQRMTSHLVESTVPEALPTIKTPGPPPTAFPRPSENSAAASKALRDSKSGGTGAGSSWISRKVLAGSGGEDLRKSVAASKRPSIFDHAMEEESDQEADELDDRKQGVSRASEAPANAQRFSIASKTPQPQHQRQTLGPSTISRPTEQPPSNLSKMIADLQERRAVATFNASVSRATIPSLQLGRGAQGIASMGISSGLLGRAALQASLERTRSAEGPAVAAALDVFDEKSNVGLKQSPDAGVLAVTNALPGPSTTEELNEAVDEILRKISTERQMQDQEPPSVTPNRPIEVMVHESIQQGNGGAATLSTPRTSSTRAEEREVEELTKRTNALSVGTRASDKFDVPQPKRSPVTEPSSPAISAKSSTKVGQPPASDPQSTTPTNSPPRILIYRSSDGRQKSLGDAQVSPPAEGPRENAKPLQGVKAPHEKPKLADETPKTHPLPSKPTSQSAVPKGLSQSTALSVESDESENSESEEERGDKRFDEDEILADEVAKLGKPLHLNTAARASIVEDSDSDESIEEVESNESRAPVSISQYRCRDTNESL